MSRSRLTATVALVAVVAGLAAAASLMLARPARAAVGPLPAEALVLPDPSFLGGIDVRKLTASAFYRKLRAEQRPAPLDALRELSERTGLDPERDIDLVVMAGSRQAGADGVALVVGRFDTPKLAGAIQARPGTRSEPLEGATLYLFEQAGQAARGLALLDERSLVIGAADGVRATLANHARDASPIKDNAALVALLGRVKPGAGFWLVGDESLLARLTALQGPQGSTSQFRLPALRALVVSGELEPALTLSVVADASDAAGAKNMADIVSGFLAMARMQSSRNPVLAELASAVRVTTEANSVTVNARIAPELIEKLGPRQTAELAR